MTSVYLHTTLGLFMFTNKSVFVTKEAPDASVQFDVRSELEKELITAAEDDSLYEFYKARFYLFH